MIEARTPKETDDFAICTSCGGTKKAPIATIVFVGNRNRGVELTLCQECGRDAANAIGFMCIRDGWSKLEPRKRKPKVEAKG